MNTKQTDPFGNPDLQPTPPTPDQSGSSFRQKALAAGAALVLAAGGANEAINHTGENTLQDLKDQHTMVVNPYEPAARIIPETPTMTEYAEPIDLAKISVADLKEKDAELDKKADHELADQGVAFKTGLNFFTQLTPHDATTGIAKNPKAFAQELLTSLKDIHTATGSKDTENPSLTGIYEAVTDDATQDAIKKNHFVIETISQKNPDTWSETTSVELVIDDELITTFASADTTRRPDYAITPDSEAALTGDLGEVGYSHEPLIDRIKEVDAQQNELLAALNLRRNELATARIATYLEKHPDMRAVYEEDLKSAQANRDPDLVTEYSPYAELNELKMLVAEDRAQKQGTVGHESTKPPIPPKQDNNRSPAGLD